MPECQRNTGSRLACSAAAHRVHDNHESTWSFSYGGVDVSGSPQLIDTQLGQFQAHWFDEVFRIGHGILYISSCTVQGTGCTVPVLRAPSREHDAPTRCTLHAAPCTRRLPRAMADEFLVTCPYCGEDVEIYLEPDVTGSFVQDCEVCCNPWRVRVVGRGDDRQVDIRRDDDSP